MICLTCIFCRLCQLLVQPFRPTDFSLLAYIQSGTTQRLLEEHTSALWALYISIKYDFPPKKSIIWEEGGTQSSHILYIIRKPCLRESQIGMSKCPCLCSRNYFVSHICRIEENLQPSSFLKGRDMMTYPLGEQCCAHFAVLLNIVLIRGGGF